MLIDKAEVQDVLVDDVEKRPRTEQNPPSAVPGPTRRTLVRITRSTMQTRPKKEPHGRQRATVRDDGVPRAAGTRLQASPCRVKKGKGTALEQRRRLGWASEPGHRTQ